MRTQRGNQVRGRVRKALLAAGALALAGWMLSPPALAHGRREGRRDVVRDHHVRVRVHHVRRHPAARFVVPHRIRVDRAATYRPYLYRSVYYPVHGHHHAVYRFPVHTEHGVVYRSHAYCSGRLFVGGRVVYDGPRLGIVVEF